MSSIAPLRRAARLVNDRADDAEFKIGLEHVAPNTGKLIESESVFDGTGVAFQPGDVLYGKLRPYLAKAWVADRPGAAVGDFLVLRPKPGFSARFVRDALLDPGAVDWVTASVFGSKMPRTNWETISQLPIRLIPEDDQLRIAEYLDRETAEIDAFIADQEELITLLTERRAATIAAEFDTRIDVGGSWEHRGQRLGQLVSERDHRVGGEDRELLSVSIHRGVRPWNEVNEGEPAAESHAHYKRVEHDDIVLNRMRAFQGAIGLADRAGMASPDYAVFQITGDTNPKYLQSLLRSRPFAEAMGQRVRGIGSSSTGVVRTPRINVYDFVRIRVDLPSQDEQREIVAHLDRETSEIDAAIADAREAIALSKERRAALISAAVTGKLDLGA